MPSAQPSSMPSDQPSSLPSAEPSSMPSAQPSSMPSDQPSAQPSSMPSLLPSSSPSLSPSSMPSAQPSDMPSFLPSSMPSSLPSSMPSSLPSAMPSSSPSLSPSSMPSSAPSAAPSSSPSLAPSAAPSSSPSLAPSAAPSLSPSAAPSSMPSAQPSAAPSSSPSSSPSDAPSSLPSVAPSSLPSSSPSTSMMPTSEPTGQPSQAPTSFCQLCAASCHGGFAANLGGEYQMTIIGDLAKVYNAEGLTESQPEANDLSTPQQSVFVQNKPTGAFVYEGVNYTFPDDTIVVAYSSDVTMIGSATSPGGGTIEVGKFEVTQINYDFTFSTINWDTNRPESIEDTFTPVTALKNRRYQYTIVKNVETLTAFRVLTGASADNLLLSAGVGESGTQYLNGFRAYIANTTTTTDNSAYCTSEFSTNYLNDTTESNVFRSGPEVMQTDYKDLLAANGWQLDGTVIPQGAASCFENTYVEVV